MAKWQYAKQNGSDQGRLGGVPAGGGDAGLAESPKKPKRPWKGKKVVRNRYGVNLIHQKRDARRNKKESIHRPPE